MTAQTAENKIELTPEKAGQISFPGITAESARTASELLQRNDREHSGFFNPRGFVNHMTHAILTSYDFGATPAYLNSYYEREKHIQRPLLVTDEKVLKDLSDESSWDKYLGDNGHYSDFLAFFQKEMQEIGWQDMINKRMFARTKAADGFLARSFAALYHGVIHLGFGLEFGLPVVVTEGLAQTAGNPSWAQDFFLKSEVEAGVAKVCHIDSGTGKSLRALLEEIRNDKKIRSEITPQDAMPWVRVISHAQDEIISYAKQYRVPVNQIDEKVIESINISAFLVGGSIRKDKQVMLDFFLMHVLTTSIFLATFMSQDWITPENKARFLEWKGRSDLLWYAAVGSPELLVDEIKNYTPKVPQAGSGNPWLGIIERGLCIGDDGHVIKTIRALVNGERVWARHRDIAERMKLPVVDDMWLKIAAMCVDSIEDVGEGVGSWIRGTGFDERWEACGPRKTYSRPDVLLTVL